MFVRNQIRNPPAIPEMWLDLASAQTAVKDIPPPPPTFLNKRSSSRNARKQGEKVCFWRLRTVKVKGYPFFVSPFLLYRSSEVVWHDEKSPWRRKREDSHFSSKNIRLGGGGSGSVAHGIMPTNHLPLTIPDTIPQLGGKEERGPYST